MREQVVIFGTPDRIAKRLLGHIALRIDRARARIRRNGKVTKRERASVECLEQRGTPQQRGLAAT